MTEALLRLALSTKQETDIETVARSILDLVSRQLRLVASSLFTLEQAGELALLYAHGHGAAELPRRIAPDASCLVAQAARRLEPQVRPAQGTPGLPPEEASLLCGEHALGARVAMPLLASGRLGGVLVCTRAQGQAFSEPELQLLASIAELGALSLETARALEQERQRRQELEHRCAHLALAQEIAQLGSWDWDVAQDSIHWSEAMSHLHGLAPSPRLLDFEGALRQIHPEDRDVVFSAINLALHDDTLGQFGLDHRIIRAGGEVRVVHSEGRVKFDERGCPLHVTGTTLDITDRVSAQEALRRSEESLRLILEQAPIGTAIVGLEGRFLQVNLALAEIVGYTPEELIQLRFQDITHPDDLETDLSHVQGLLSGRIRSYRLSKRYIRKDGSIVDVLLHGTVVRDSKGRPVHFVAQVEDVSEQKRAQEELRRIISEFRELLERVPDGILIHVDDCLVYANPALLRMLGFAAQEELLGGAPHERVHPDDWLQARLGAMRKGGSTSSPELIRLRRKDGSLIETEARVLRIHHEGKDAVLMMARDVTAREKAHREREQLVHEMATRRRWLEQVLDRLPVGVILIERSLETASADHVWGNRQAARLFGHGFSPEAGTQQYVGQVCDLSGRPLAREELPSSRVLRGQVVANEEVLLRRPDGSSVTVRGAAEPLWGEAGQLLGVVGVFEDVTQLKEVERMREEWMSIIAHDLRQPVTIIQAYVGLLGRTLQDERAAAKLLHVENATRRLRRMIEDLLDISRIEARRIELHLEPLDLVTVLHAVAERMAATQQGRELRLEVVPALASVSADCARVEQVLENLLSNAYKYGEPGRPVILGARNHGEDVLVWVSNEGQGIAPEELPRLFSRFHRAGERRKEGIGLGLYIARGLIEAQGGLLWAESRPGESTTFSFTLPAQPWVPEPKQPPAPPREMAEEKPPQAVQRG